ncbi:MAG: hypothetical protein EB059_11275 [Alphaproteobacteria bacterium]|nr:hypothetical protein [Alphaproteobacteria bacterium]
MAFVPPVYGMVNWLERKGYLARFAQYYDPTKINLPSDAFEGLSAIEARIGQLQCSRYAYIIAHRRKIARLYFEGLGGVKELTLPENASGATWSHFVIYTPKAKDIIAKCLAHGIQLGELIDYDIIDMPAYQNAIYHGTHRAREFVHNVINLPVHVGVSEKDARRIVDVITLCAST